MRWRDCGHGVNHRRDPVTSGTDVWRLYLHDNAKSAGLPCDASRSGRGIVNRHERAIHPNRAVHPVHPNRRARSTHPTPANHPARAIVRT